MPLTTQRKFSLLLLTLAALITLPMIGALSYFKWSHPLPEKPGPTPSEIAAGIDPVYQSPLPSNFFEFPPISDQASYIQQMRGAEGDFNLWIFSGLLGFFILVLSAYLWPRAFGFKQVKSQPSHTPLPLPHWFYWGSLIFAIPTAVLLSHTSQFPMIRHWAVIPQFWGFALLMDGLVYRRTGGQSLVAQNPRMLLGIGLASIPGWMIFEYLNFFIAQNWYYPFGNMISKGRFMFYALLGSSGLMAMAIEWYDYLRSFPQLWARYSQGPKINLSPRFLNVVLILSLISLVLAPYAPSQFFFMLWVSPLLILMIVLAKLGIWTPATPIRQSGNWSYILLLALAFFLQGIIHELLNYASGWGQGTADFGSYNPDYWVYCVPYINVWHVGEMPLIGLMGYLPFGIYCGVWWICFAYLFNMPTQFEQEQKQLDQE